MTLRSQIAWLAFGVLVALPVASAAQSTPAITFGLTGGVNSASIKSDSSPNVGRRLGAVGGLFLGARITDTVGLHVEGLFSQRGGTDETVGSDVKFRINYLDVPVLLKVGSGSGGTRFHAVAGAQASYKLKAEASSEMLDLTVDLDDEIEDLDFSVVFGAGVEMGRLSLVARYALGLSNIATTPGDDGKNRTFSLMAGIRLK